MLCPLWQVSVPSLFGISSFDQPVKKSFDLSLSVYFGCGWYTIVHLNWWGQTCSDSDSDHGDSSQSWPQKLTFLNGCRGSSGHCPACDAPKWNVVRVFFDISLTAPRACKFSWSSTVGSDCHPAATYSNIFQLQDSHCINSTWIGPLGIRIIRKFTGKMHKISTLLNSIGFPRPQEAPKAADVPPWATRGQYSQWTHFEYFDFLSRRDNWDWDFGAVQYKFSIFVIDQEKQLHKLNYSPACAHCITLRLFRRHWPQTKKEGAGMNRTEQILDTVTWGQFSALVFRSFCPIRR